MTVSLTIERDFSLRHLNTFGIEASAAAYLRITAAGQLAEIARDASLNGLSQLVLGGGSNIVLTGDFPGLVLHMMIEGIDVIGADADAVYVRAAAGESWHGFVQWTLAQGWGGLENLSLIPGSVGAAPIQNIGAYGAELPDFRRNAHVCPSRDLNIQRIAVPATTPPMLRQHDIAEAGCTAWYSL